MTISDSFDKLPGVLGVAVDVVDERLKIRVSVSPDSPADCIFKTCKAQLIGWLPGGKWYSLPIMSKEAMDRLIEWQKLKTIQSANATKPQPPNET